MRKLIGTIVFFFKKKKRKEIHTKETLEFSKKDSRQVLKKKNLPSIKFPTCPVSLSFFSI